MKILAYVHRYQGMGHNAGGETSLHAALRYLVRQGHECTVLVGQETSVPSYELDGVQVVTTDSDTDIKSQPFDYFPWADVIVTQLTCANRAGIVAGMFRKPVIHYMHNDHPSMLRTLGKYAWAGLYNTNWVRESTRAADVWTPGPVLHPVVDPELYATKRTRAAKYVTLVNLSMGGDGLYDKGYKTFFELAKRNPDIPFLGVRGAYGEQAYESLPNVTYMDHTADMTEVYKKTKVLLVPSKYESFGRVAVEAAASGIPSICSSTPGLEEALAGYGTYAQYGDYDKWDELLKTLMDPNGTAYSLHSAEAKHRSEFLWKQSQEELEELAVMFEIIESAGFHEYYDYLSVR